MSWCPLCKDHAIPSHGESANCQGCGARWAMWGDYREEASEIWGGGGYPVPKLMEQLEVEDGYITDGTLQGDLDKLIALTAINTEAAFAKEIFDAARIMVEGKATEDALNEVMAFLNNLVNVTKMVKERA
jgi:hypothetical protein